MGDWGCTFLFPCRLWGAGGWEHDGEYGALLRLYKSAGIRAPTAACKAGMVPLPRLWVWVPLACWM